MSHVSDKAASLQCLQSTEEQEPDRRDKHGRQSEGSLIDVFAYHDETSLETQEMHAENEINNLEPDVSVG